MATSGRSSFTARPAAIVSRGGDPSQSNDHSTIELANASDWDDQNNPGSGATNVAMLEDVPPDGGYGWVCTVCAFLINANTWGVNAAWGIFLDRYLTWDSYPGATKLEYAMIGGLSISQAFFISPIIAAIQKRIGTRYTTMLGTVLIFVGLFAASATTQVWQLLLSIGFCSGWGMGLLYIPSMNLLSPWFSAHRSLAVGLATSGAGLGGLVYSLLTGRLIEMLGVAWTWRILGFTSLSMNLICSLLLRERPSSPAAPLNRPSFNPRDFVRTQVLLVLGWGFLTEFGYVTLWYSLPSYATSIDLSPSQGSVIQAIMSLMLGLGRPVIGYYSDRMGRINMALCMTLSCGVLCLTLWILARNYAGLLVFAAAAGLMSGTFWSTVNPILADVVGITEAGRTFGVICFALVLPTTFATAIALQLVQGSAGINQFLPSQIFVGIMFIAGSVSLWLLRSWKITEIERKAEDERQSVLHEREAGRISAIRSRMGPAWLNPRKLFMVRRV